jgi:flagellar capping protein FliD
MKKTLIAMTLAVACTGVQAHNEQCQYSLDYNISIKNGLVSYTGKNNDSVVFQDGKLKINGKSIELNAEQQRASFAFENKTKETLPKIAEVAIEGAELGLKAASIVVTSLFGDDQDVHKDLIEPIEAISTKLKANINKDNLNTLSLDKSFDAEFDQEIEQLVSKALSKYSGKIIGQVLSSLFNSDSEEVKDFEFRMENLEHDIETYVSSHAEPLEAKAEKLCDDFKALAELDSKLESIESYPTNGLIEIGDHSGVSASSFTFNSD